MRPPSRRRRPLSSAAQVALALGGSVLLNLLLAAGVGLAVQLWPTPPLEGPAPPLRLDFTHEPEPEPDLTAQSSPPKPTPPPYLRTEERQRQDKPPEDAYFQSDKDTANASEAPPTGELPLPSQEGRKLPTIEFDTREYIAGDKAADDAGQGPPPVAQAPPAPTPRPVDPPRPQVNRETPRPTPAPTPVAVATPTPAPTPLAPRPDPNEFALRAPTPTPPPMPDFRAVDPPRPQPTGPPLYKNATAPTEALPPVTNPGSPGYRPQTVKTKMEGGLSTRGPSSIAARDTPLGRYQKAVSDAIGSRWYFGIQQNADTVQIGTVKVRFYIDPNGRVRRPEIIQGSSGSSLASVSITAVIEANLPPMPAEIASTLPNNQMEIDFTFSNL